MNNNRPFNAVRGQGARGGTLTLARVAMWVATTTAERGPRSTMTAEIDRDFLRLLRRIGFAEGVSTLVLFGVALPLKYVWDQPLAVTIVGALHGLLFVALVGMLCVAADRVPIGRRSALIGAVAAVVPFGPFVFDRRLARLAE